MTALMLAAMNGHNQVVLALIEAGADIEDRDSRVSPSNYTDFVTFYFIVIV
jgi:ankyrin repeat protein